MLWNLVTSSWLVLAPTELTLSLNKVEKDVQVIKKTYST
jgi:hypothetical protein